MTGGEESQLPKAESFIVASNDAIYRRAGSPEIVTGLVGGPILIGLGIAFLWLSATRGVPAGLFAGPLCLIAGGFLFLMMVRYSRRQLERVDVGDKGLGFYFKGERPRIFTWNQKPLDVKLLDYRGREPRARTWYKVPCAVDARGVAGGISAEAADAIESVARRAGLEVLVKESPTVRWVRIRAH